MTMDHSQPADIRQCFLFTDFACRDPGCPSPSDLFAVLPDAGEQLFRKAGDEEDLVGIDPDV
jgi:hypothetical protein